LAMARWRASHDRVVFKQGQSRPAIAIRSLAAEKACSIISMMPAPTCRPSAAGEANRARRLSCRGVYESKNPPAAANRVPGSAFTAGTCRRARTCGSPRESRPTAGSPTLEIAYLLENLPADLAGALRDRAELFLDLPAGADDRYLPRWPGQSARSASVVSSI